MPASLLYEATQALTQEELSALGSNGLLELCALDRRFHPFEHSLFGPAAEGFMRGLQTAEATAKIDRTVGSFLQLLSPHFLHGAAHKALEFLIRRFEIHKYNVDAVLACALPYHGTRWFVRLVQLLRLKDTCWGWLQGKQGMAPPARASFVARCRKDERVLKQLCLLGFGQAQEPCSRGRVAFATVVVLEMLSSSPSVAEPDLLVLLPHVFRLIAPHMPAHAQVAGQMLVAQLSARAHLSRESAVAIADGLCACLAAAHARAVAKTCIQCLVALLRRQRVSAQLDWPSSAGGKDACWLVALLELGDSCDVTLLLRPVFRMLATRAPADAAGHAESSDVLHRIRSLPLDARSIAALLFHLEASGEEEASEFLRAQIRSAAKRGGRAEDEPPCAPEHGSAVQRILGLQRLHELSHDGAPLPHLSRVAAMSRSELAASLRRRLGDSAPVAAAALRLRPLPRLLPPEQLERALLAQLRRRAADAASRGLIAHALQLHAACGGPRLAALGALPAALLALARRCEAADALGLCALLQQPHAEPAAPLLALGHWLGGDTAAAGGAARGAAGGAAGGGVNTDLHVLGVVAETLLQLGLRFDRYGPSSCASDVAGQPQAVHAADPGRLQALVVLAGAPTEALGPEALTLWCAERLLRALPCAAALPAAAQRAHELLLRRLCSLCLGVREPRGEAALRVLLRQQWSGPAIAPRLAGCWAALRAPALHAGAEALTSGGAAAAAAHGRRLRRVRLRALQLAAVHLRALAAAAAPPKGVSVDTEPNGGKPGKAAATQRAPAADARAAAALRLERASEQLLLPLLLQLGGPDELCRGVARQCVNELCAARRINSADALCAAPAAAAPAAGGAGQSLPPALAAALVRSLRHEGAPRLLAQMLAQLPDDVAGQLLTYLASQVHAALAAELGASGGGVTSGLAPATPCVALLRALLAARYAQQPPPAALALLLLRSLLLPALHLVRRRARRAAAEEEDDGAGAGAGAEEVSAGDHPCAGAEDEEQAEAELVALLMVLVRLPTSALLAQLTPPEAEACVGPLLAALTVHRGLPVPLHLVPLHIAALEAIDAPLYEALGTEAREQLFSALCDCLQQGPAVRTPPPTTAAAAAPPHISPASALYLPYISAMAAAAQRSAAALQATMHSLPLDAAAFARRLQRALGSARGASAAARQASLAHCVVTLEVLQPCVQRKGGAALPDAEQLVAPLFALLAELRATTEVAEGEHDVTDYLAQLALAALSDVCAQAHGGALDPSEPPPRTAEAAAVQAAAAAAAAAEAAAAAPADRPPALARAVSEHFDLPLLVAWLHDPSRPEVAHHVLGLLRVGAWLLPATALQQVMPLFASVGQSALWRDSDASLGAVQQAMQALLPIMLRKGLQVRPLLRGCVRLALALPAQRRLGLLDGTIDTLLGPRHTCAAAAGEARDVAGADHLHCVALLLLHRHLAELGGAARGAAGEEEGGEEADSDSDDEDASEDSATHRRALTRDAAAPDEHMRLCAALCGGARPEVQMRLYALLVGTMLRLPPQHAAAATPKPKHKPKGAAAAPADGAPADGAPPTRALKLLLIAFVSQQLEANALRFKVESAANTAALREASRILFDALVATAEHAMAQAAVAQQPQPKEPQARAGAAAGGAPASEHALWSGLARSAQATVTTLSTLLPPATFMQPIARLLGCGDSAVQSFAVRLLRAQLDRPQRELQTDGTAAQVAEMTASIRALLPPVANTAPAAAAEGGAPPPAPAQTPPRNQQAALLSLEILARTFAAAHPQPFERTLAAAAAAARAPSEAVRSSGLVLCATLVRELGARCVPHLPVLVPELLAVLEAASVPRRAAPAAAAEAALLVGTWCEGVGRAIVATLPQFISPYLPRLLRALLCAAALPTPAASAPASRRGAAHGAADASGAQLGAAVRGLQLTLAETLPTRLLVPPLLDAAGAAQQLGPAACTLLLTTLGASLQRRPQAEVQALHKPAFQLLLSLARHRTARCGEPLAPHAAQPPPEVGGARCAARTVEAALSDAFVHLTIQLTEQQFRPLFLRLLAWAFPADEEHVAPARALAFFRLIAGAQAKLQSLFAAYFALALPHARRVLASTAPPPPAAPAAAAMPGSAAKKKRKRPTEDGEQAAAAAAGAALPCGPTEAALLHATLGFVSRGLRHDGRRAVTLTEIHELEAPLLARLGWPHAEGSLALAVRARAEPALLDALSQLVLVLGVDGCKRLHYELCVATRAEAAPRKLAAVRGLARLYGALKESAPVHIPEAVPFVAELLEDSELEVRQEALALMRSLEQLAGEELVH